MVIDIYLVNHRMQAANKRMEEYEHHKKMINFYYDFVISIMKKCVPDKDESWYQYELIYLLGILYI